MVNKFYRKLLITTINLSLLLFQTPLAFSGVTETKGQINTDSQGNKSQTIDYKFDGVGSSDMISSITMLGIGTIAARMATSGYKPYTKDMLAAAASGAAFIGGEVYSNIAMKKEIEALTLQIEKKSSEEFENQLERIKELKESYEKVQKTLKTKKTLQLAAATGFGVASGIAAYMALQSNAQLVSCASAAKMAVASLSACAASSVAGNATEAAACGTCVTQMGALSGLVSTYMSSKDAPGPSISIFSQNKSKQAAITNTAKLCSVSGGKTASAVGKSVDGVCSKAILYDQAVETAGMPITKVEVLKNSTPIRLFVLQKVLENLFPQAHAGWMPLIALTGSALVAYKFITGAIGAKIDTFMATPKNRAMVWASFGALSLTASKSTGKVLDEVEGYIKKLDEIIQDLEKFETGAKLAKASNSTIDTKDLLTNIKNTLNPDVSTETASTCVTGQKSDGTCASLTEQLKSISGTVNIPTSLASLGSDLASLGDSLNSGKISEGTLGNANAIAGKKAAVNKALKNQEKVVKKLSNGKPTTNEKELLADLNKRTAANLKKAGISPGSFLSSMGGVPFKSGSDADLANAVEEKNEGFAETKPIEANAVNVAPEKKTNDLDFKLVDDSNSGDAPVNPALSQLSHEDFSEMTGDIGNSNGPSLFEIISSRYVKSGYPKLLEEEVKEK